MHNTEWSPVKDTSLEVLYEVVSMIKKSQINQSIRNIKIAILSINHSTDDVFSASAMNSYYSS